MKYLILLVSLLIISCDRELFYDYIIENNSFSNVYIEYENNNSVVFYDTVSSESSVTFNILRRFGNSVNEFELSRLYKSFSLRTDSSHSDLDYTDNKYWEYTEQSETHAEYRLIVDSTHFE